MKKSDLVRKSMQILMEHYQNSDTMLEDCSDQDFVWIESGESSCQSRKPDGRKKEKACEKPPFLFSLQNVVLTACTGTDCVCEIILQYQKDTWLKKSRIRTQTEQMHLTWIPPQNRNLLPEYSCQNWKVFMISVTCIAEKAERPCSLSACRDLKTQEPVHGFGDSSRMVKIHVHDKSIRLLEPASIVWAESTGIHSLIHTPLGTIEASESIHMLEKLCSSFLLRPHISYLVNPAYILTIRRFEIELSDGSVIPIPQKKYTQIRDLILGCCQAQSPPRRRTAAAH